MKIGIDLGGTTVSIGLVNEEQRIVEKTEEMTLCEQGAEAVTGRMIHMTEQLLQGAGNPAVTHIGIGCPGILERKSGTVIYSNNIMWEHVPVGQRFQERFGIPVYVENDANCAAVGEYMAGAGRGCSHMVMLTLGTGIGGGMILNGKLYLGKHGNANILGHLLMEKDGKECTCKRKGCWEGYASAGALLRMAKEAGMFQEVPDTALNGRLFFQAVDKKEEAAVKVLDRYLDYVSEGIADLINILDPERIVIGGGISARGEQLIAPVREKVKRKVYFKDMEMADIVCSQLGNDAAIIGAASLPEVKQTAGK